MERVGVGCIVRDHEENPLLAASLLEGPIVNTESVEAVAILRGLQPMKYQNL